MLTQPNFPSLSVVVPIGNFENHIDSITTLVENARNINAEIILVLDGNTRLDYERARNLLSQFNANGTVTETNGKNPGGSRNKGLELATKSWVVFWDCDDSANAPAVVEMISKAEQNGFEVAIGGYEMMDLNSGRCVQFLISRNTWRIDVGLNPGIWRFAFKRDFIDSVLFPELCMGEDQIFLQRIFARNPRILITDGKVYTYNIGVGEQLTSMPNKIKDLIKANLIAKSELSNQKMYAQIARTMIARQSLTLCKQHDLEWNSRLNYFLKACTYFMSHPVTAFKTLRLMNHQIIFRNDEGGL